MTVSGEDLAVAQALASEVREAAGRRRTWRKVTTLLDLFGQYRLTPSVRARMAEALRAAGLEAEPPIEELDRYQTVRLTVDDNGDRPVERTQEEATPTSGASPSGGILGVEEWRPAQAPRQISMARASSTQGPVWVDIDADSADPQEIYDLLAPLCGSSLTPEMIDDLVDADPLPKVRRYSDDGRVRSVSSVEVTACEPEAEATTASTAGALVFQLVEFLCFDRWLITCWHRRRVYRGAEEVAEEDPRGHEVTIRRVAERWLDGPATTASDLGILVLQELAESYGPARRELYAWLESWELDFYRREDSAERATLIDLRGLQAEFRRRLNALNQPRHKAEHAWFYGVTDVPAAERVDILVDRSLKDLRELSEELRSAFDIVQSQSTARQLALAQRQQDQTKGLQQKLELITAVLLVPTLVAGIFGANTYLPGKEQTLGFELMLVLMVVGAVSAYMVVRAPRKRAERAASEESDAQAAP
jgi:Mg2+ and Co2+ transporter CorA